MRTFKDKIAKYNMKEWKKIIIAGLATSWQAYFYDAGDDFVRKYEIYKRKKVGEKIK